jgi:hypothetical protein
MKKFLILFLIVLVVLGGVYFFLKHSKEKPNEAPLVVEEPVNVIPGLYKNDQFGFTINYGEERKIEEFGTKVFIYETATSTNATVVAEIISAAFDAELPYEQFVLDETRSLCMEAGTEAECTKVNDLSSITNKAGLSAQKFYLVLKTALQEREKGPFIAFNLSEKTPGMYTFLLIHPPIASPGSVNLINEIADSVSLE